MQCSSAVQCSLCYSVLLSLVVPFSWAVPNDASLFRPFCTSLLAPVGCGAVSLALRTVILLLLGGACSATFSFAVEGLRFSFPIADRSLFSCCSRWNVRHFCGRIVAGLVVQPLPVFASPATPTFSVGGFFTGQFAKAEYLEAVSQPPSAPKLTEKCISLQPFGVLSPLSMSGPLQDIQTWIRVKHLISDSLTPLRCRLI